MSNASALGYAILAMEKAGLSKEKIQRVVLAMEDTFDEVEEESASLHYCKSEY